MIFEIITDTGQKTFFEIFSPLLVSLIITASFGLLTGIYFERIKNKLLILTYNVSFQPLGTAIADKFWGDIEISHNGRAIKHLNFVTIVIKNSSRIDAENFLTLEAWLDNRSQFLGHNGFYNTGNTVFLEENYFNQYNKALDGIQKDVELAEHNEHHVRPPELDALLNYVQGNRKLSLPTFNRKSHITVNFLIENFDGVIPKIYLSILQKGIKLIPEEDRVKAENIKKIATGSITLLLYILALWWVFLHFPLQNGAIMSTVVAGWISYILGFAFYYLFIYLKKFFW